MISYSHAYLVGSLLLSPLWISLLLYRKDLYKKMFTMSVIGGAFAVIFAPPFLKDYWHPIYTFRIWGFGGIEDFLYGFFIIGIASVIYEVLFKRRTRKNKDDFSKLILPIIILSVISFYSFVYLGLPSIYAALAGPLILICIILIHRNDLIIVALLGGLIMCCLVLVGFSLFFKIYPDIINRFWDLNGINSHTIIGIPLGELLWAFGLGATAGPVYDFIDGRVFK